MHAENDSPYIYPVTEYESFTWQEFLFSETAQEYGIPNEPSAQEREAIRQLVIKLIHPLRLLYGDKFYITSGYRSPALNELVRGIPGSQHTKGEAVDIGIMEGPEFLLDILQTSGLDFDQAIVYHDNYFIHLSYCANGKNRREIILR